MDTSEKSRKAPRQPAPRRRALLVRKSCPQYEQTSSKNKTLSSASRHFQISKRVFENPTCRAFCHHLLKKIPSNGLYNQVIPVFLERLEILKLKTMYPLKEVAFKDISFSSCLYLIHLEQASKFKVLFESHLRARFATIF